MKTISPKYKTTDKKGNTRFHAEYDLACEFLDKEFPETATAGFQVWDDKKWWTT